MSREDITVCSNYDDASADKENINRPADTCYLPTNEILYRQIIANKGKFRISFSISGTALELLLNYRPDVIQSFKKLAETGCVEFMAETYYHSLSSLHSQNEFERQVFKHAEFIKRLFNADTKIFRNTELIHNNQIAARIAAMDFKAILCEGIERILRSRTPNQLYKVPGSGKIVLLLRNAALSDDITFRFDDPDWTEHPLTAEEFAEWIHSHPEETDIINLLMDYETFGVYKKADTGIFDFLESLPAAVLSKKDVSSFFPAMQQISILPVMYMMW